MTEKNSIDRMDRKILAVLQEDGRITNQELADRVALSPGACLARVKRMEKSVIINGYKAQVDVTKLGPSLTIFAELTSSAYDTTNNRKIETIRSVASMKKVKSWTGVPSDTGTCPA